jgi:hypothetical protein
VHLVFNFFFLYFNQSIPIQLFKLFEIIFVSRYSLKYIKYLLAFRYWFFYSYLWEIKWFCSHLKGRFLLSRPLRFLWINCREQCSYRLPSNNSLEPKSSMHCTPSFTRLLTDRLYTELLILLPFCQEKEYLFLIMKVILPKACWLLNLGQCCSSHWDFLQISIGWEAV